MNVIYQEGLQHRIMVYAVQVQSSGSVVSVANDLYAVTTAHFYSTNLDAILGVTVSGMNVTIDPGGGHSNIVGFLMCQGEGKVS